jgi:hypothetical protein
LLSRHIRDRRLRLRRPWRGAAGSASRLGVGGERNGCRGLAGRSRCMTAGSSRREAEAAVALLCAQQLAAHGFADLLPVEIHMAMNHNLAAATE